MLKNTFFRVSVAEKLPDKLLFEKDTVGAFSFDVPYIYDYVVIEYAGASGGQSNWGPILGGQGAILSRRVPIKKPTITGFVGAMGHSAMINGDLVGGAGYSNGEDGTTTQSGHAILENGGGGGSTGVVIDNVVYEASGGGGSSGGTAFTGGRGGGPYGGKGQQPPQNNAKDPGAIGYNAGNGYVKIWGGFDVNDKG